MGDITLQQIAGVLTLAVTIGSSIGAVIGWAMKPIQKRNDETKKIEERMDSVEQHLDNDNKRLNCLESDTKQILLSVNSLLSHSIDNNHTDALKERKAELDEYLIKR